MRCPDGEVSRDCKGVGGLHFRVSRFYWVPSILLTRWAEPVLTRRERTGRTPNLGFVLVKHDVIAITRHE